MDKKPKISLFVVLAFCFISLLCFSMHSFAYANQKVSASLSTDKTEVYSEETVKCFINVQDISKNKNIDVLQGKLNYNGDVFHPLTANDFVLNHGWSNIKFNSDSGEFIVIKNSEFASDNVFTINLKAKTGFKGQNALITLSDLKMSDGNNIITSEANISTQISAIEESSILNGINNGNSQYVNQSTVPVAAISVFKLRNYSIIALAALILLGLLFHIYKFKNKNESVYKIIMFSLVPLLCVLIYGLGFSLASKGELNNDKNIDIADIYLFQDCLLDVSPINGSKKIKADMNNDGTIDIKDLSLLVKKVFIKQANKAQISGVELSNYFPNKNEELELKLNILIDNGLKAEYITINGVEYNIAFLDNGQYSLKLKAADTVGKQTLSITNLKLSNGESVNVSYNEDYNVLKSIPQLVDYAINKDTNNNRVTLQFKVLDPDKAVFAFNVSVLDPDGNTIFTSHTYEQENSMSFDVNPGIKYNVFTKLDYVLVGDSLEHSTEHSGTIYKEESFTLKNNEIVKETIKTDSNQNNESIGILNDNTVDNSISNDDAASDTANNNNINNDTSNNDTTEKEPLSVEISTLSVSEFVEKAGVGTVEYQITNNRNESVTKVRINNNDIPVTKIAENKYSVEFIAPSTSGKLDLNTNKVFVGEESVDVSEINTIEILKTPFTINNYSIENSSDPTSNVILKFTVHDPEDTFINGNLQVVDSAGNIVKDIPYNSGDNSVGLSVAMDTLYTIKITGKYGRDIAKSKYVSEGIMLEKPLYLHTDYDKTIENVTTYNNSDSQTSYFNKNEEVTIKFTNNNTSPIYITDATVNGNKYAVSKDENIYTLKTNSPASSGIFDYTIESLTLSSGEEIILNNKPSAKIDVLKDRPTVQNFRYGEAEYGKMRITFDLVDTEGALTNNAKVSVADANTTIVTQDVSAGSNSIAFDYVNKTSYKFIIKASYDLDSNSIDTSSNSVIDGQLSDKDVMLSNDNLELKDIVKTTLYHNENGKINEVNSLDITSGIPTDLDNYYMEIDMQSLPTLYTEVKSFNKTEDKLYAVADLNEFIQYSKTNDGITTKREVSFNIPYTDNGQSHSTITSADAWFKEIAKNLNGSYTLTSDLDASSITGNAAVLGTFQGTINGNGYTIYNLQVPLFETVNGATITNLNIEDANVTGSAAKGILANKITNGSRIENCYIKSSTINIPSGNQIGGFVGVIDNSTISKCGVEEISIRANNTMGGIAGQTNAGSVIENCYVTGTLSGSISHHLGARIGGISGWHNSTIDKCYTNVNISAPSRTGNGGLIGGPSTNAGAVKNSIGIADGNTHRIGGFTAALTKVENVYEYSNSKGATNITDATREKIKETANVNSMELYTTTLGMDASIWNYVYGKTIELQNYDIIKHIPNYDENNVTSYFNISKIAPYANVEDWVKYGNAITDADLLSKKISFVLPMNSNDNHIVGINKGLENSVTKIKVVFVDGSFKEYNTSFSHTSDNIIAIYNIDSLNMPYHFNKYVANISTSLKSSIVNTLEGYDYTTDIASTTSEAERRQYVDYYNETTKNNLGDFVEKLIMTQENYPSYNDNPVLQDKLKQDLMNKDTLVKLVYGYNYFSKWYSFNIGDVEMLNLLYFDGQILNSDLTVDYLTKQLYQNTRDTTETTVFYNTVLQPKVGKNLFDTLEFFMTVDGSTDPNTWFKDNFKGVMYEQPAIGVPDDMNIKYRTWDNLLKGSGREANLLLPIMTTPQEDMLLFSTPSHLIIGSMNRYYDNNTAENREKMLESMRQYGQWMGKFYGTSASVIPNSENILNSLLNVTYDTRFNYPSTGKYSGTQEPGTTEEPIFKWFNESVQRWSAANGLAAYALESNIYWVGYAAFGNEWIFTYTFTHENAHVQEGRYFYAGYGRRNGSGPEAHADGNITQTLSDGSMVFNLYKDFDITADVTNNLTTDRINSPAEIHDYFKDMFETSYVMDYLIAQAFFKLTPDEQAKVAVQASHQADGKSLKTTYSRLTSEQLASMKLDSMDDLWDNQIMLRSPSTAESASYGTYDAASLWSVNWYQPHNDNGTPDSNSFKRLGQEMLGIGGYENGYIAWMSGKSANDLEALRTATGDSNITWRSYKLGRYEDIANKINNIPYFEADKVIAEIESALKTDAANGNLNTSTNLKKIYYHIVKRATNDFVDGDVYTMPNVTMISSANQLINAVKSNKLGNFKLAQDIDFKDITPTSAYYMEQLVGTLDGNGHKIKGLAYPLFNNITYANIKNINIEEPVFNINAQSILSVSSKNVIIENIAVNQTNIRLPLVNTKNGLYYEYGIQEPTVQQVEITTVEQFLAIGNDALSLRGHYVLGADLDFVNSNIANTPIINAVFGGILDGNGHTISNIKSAIFNEISNGEVKNLKINNVTITNAASKGVVANILRNSNIVDVQIADVSIKLSGTAQNIGGLVGASYGTVSISRASVDNAVLNAWWNIGGLVGVANNPITFNDVMFKGTLTGTRHNQPYDGRMAGVIGSHNGVTINNAFVDVTITSPNNTLTLGNGGFTGGPSNKSAIISNSVAIANGSCYRIGGHNTITVDNVYESKASTGIANVLATSGQSIKVATTGDITSDAFYKTSLGWKEDIWDFSKLSTSGYPTIK